MLPARVHYRRGLLLLALGLFQLWLWGTRVMNLLGAEESFSAAFVAVHLVLYAAAIGAGLVLVALGWRFLRESVMVAGDRRSDAQTDADATAVSR